MIRLFLLIACYTAFAAPAAGHWAVGGCPGGVCPLERMPRDAASDEPHYRDQRELPAVVRVSNRQGATQALGSGTLVDKNREHGLVLTCAHLFDDGVGTVVVQFAGGKSYGAKVLEIDRAWDLAALLIYAPNVEPVAVADATPRIGTALESCGYGVDGRLWCNRGRLLRAVTAQGTPTPESFELSGSARQGDSGGPVLDGERRLVGVLFGANGQVVAATGCGPVRRFLARFSSRFRAATPSARANEKPATEAPQFPRPLPDVSPKTDSAEPNNSSVERSLAQLAERVEAAHERWNEAQAAIAEQRGTIATWQSRWQSLDTRIGSLASLVDGDALRITIRDIVDRSAGTSAGGISAGLWATVWPLLAGALGLSTPPTAAFVAWKLFRLLIGRARRKRQSRSSMQSMPSTKARRGSLLNDDYARQLVEVFQHSGRSPVQDATLGREYNEELRRAEASSDGALARFAKTVRDRVETRFHRIHGMQPTPAEPVDQAASK